MRRVTEPLLLSGTALAAQIRASVLQQATERTAARGRMPRIVSVVASADPSTLSYVNSKARTAGKVGMQLDVVDLGVHCTQEQLDARVTELSNDSAVDAIIIEFPLAPGLDADRVLDRLEPAKDVDGLTPTNMGRLLAGRGDGLIAATPLACIELAQMHAPIAGRSVAVIGRGRTVGRPLAALLLQYDATPHVCHTRTQNLGQIVRSCDVVMAAAGKAGMVGDELLREGHVVIDAAINVVGENVVGDVDRDAAVRAGVAALTPVPGGVGPVTTAILFRNVLRALELQEER